MKPKIARHDALETFADLPWRVWVKRRRKELNLSQAQLAERVSYSFEMLSRVERGVNPPSLDMAIMLAAALGVADEQRPAFLRAAGVASEQAPAIRPAADMELPRRPLGRLIGRAEDYSRAHQALAQPGQQLLTISGPPGVGKTRLALELAHSLKAAYPDGVCWIDLTAVRGYSAALEAIAARLGIAVKSGAPLDQSVIAALGGRRILLLLDNCEQVLEIDRLADALLAAPELQLVVTARTRLRISGEQHLPLAPLPVPPTAAAGQPDLLAYPAFELFVARAQQTAPEFKLDGATSASVAQICAALDGLPLALELAAVRVRLLPPQIMSTRLHSRLDWLTGGPRDLPERQQTLVNAIGWSYQLLTPAQQRLFVRLGAFAGGFSLAAARAVCGENEAELLDTIGELHEASLIYTAGGAHQEPRYGMLETIAEFARARLAESGAEHRVRAAHLEYYAELAEDGRSATLPVDQRLDLLDREQANLYAALEWGVSAAGNRDHAARLGVALGWYWARRGHWRSGRAWLDRLMGVCAAAAGPPAAELPGAAAWLAFSLGEYDAAEQYLARDAGADEGPAAISQRIKTLHALGMIHYGRSDFRQSRRLYAACLELCRAHGEQRYLADTLIVLGTLNALFGEQQAGEQLLGEGLALWTALGDARGQALALNGCGIAAQLRDDLAEARELFMRSSALYRSVHDPMGQALLLNQLGANCLAAGDLSGAAHWLAQALELAQQVENPWCASWARCYRAELALLHGDSAEAARQLEASLALATMLDSKAVLSAIRVRQAWLAASSGDRAAATARLREAAALHDALGIDLAPFEQRLIAAVELLIAGR